MSVAKKKPVVLRNIVADMKDFDWEVYLLNYSDLASKGIRTKQDACNHYKNIGFWERRSSRVPDKFNATSYMQTHSHLNLKTPREAYIHFMNVGKVLRRNESVRQNIRPYRLPVASQRRPVPWPHATTTNIATNTAPSPPPAQKTPAVARRIFQPSVVKRAAKTIVPTLLSFTQTKKHVVKQPKPGQLVLTEAPSSYFQKHFKIGPPKYLN